MKKSLLWLVILIIFSGCGYDCSDPNPESFNPSERYINIERTHKFRIDTSELTEGQVNDILDAFDKYNSYFPGLFEYVPNGESDITKPDYVASVIFLTEDLDAPTLARANIFIYEDYISNFVIKVHPRAFSYNFYLVMIHEIGHVLGFRHYVFDSSIMEPCADCMNPNDIDSFLGSALDFLVDFT